MCPCHQDHIHTHRPGETPARRRKGCLTRVHRVAVLAAREVPPYEDCPQVGLPPSSPPGRTGAPRWRDPCTQKGAAGRDAPGAVSLPARCGAASSRGEGPSPRAVLPWGAVPPRRQLPRCQSAEFQRISNVSGVSFPLTGLFSCRPWRMQHLSSSKAGKEL